MTISQNSGGAGAPGCPVVDRFDPLDPVFTADPLAVLAELPPVCYTPVIDYYVVTSADDVETVFRDHESFSAAVAQQPLVGVTADALKILMVDGAPPEPSMVSLDGDAHTRLRRPATRAFTAKRVAAMEPRIRATMRDLLTTLDGRDHFDLMEHVAFPLPATTIFNMIGIPAADHALLKRWCGSRADLFWGRPHAPEQVDIARNIAANRSYLGTFVEDRDRHRADDLTSDLLAIRDGDPDRLSLPDIASILFSLMFAGHETTTSLIGNAAHRLLEGPGWNQLVADPSLAPAVVDETLRFDTSVPMWRRITTRPVSIGGVDLPAGARVLLWLAAAGRDPRRHTRPDTFDPAQRRTGQLAFGVGAHFCLGAALGRLESVVALQELAARFPRMTLDDAAPRFRPNLSFRGPIELWVRLSRTCSPGIRPRPGGPPDLPTGCHRE